MRALEKNDRMEAYALRLLLLTGARKSESLKARWENIRLDLRMLIVPLSKSGKSRHTLLSDAALGVLHAMPRTLGNPWLFPGHAPGKPLSGLSLFWTTLRRELGLADVRIHDLWHTFASFLVNAGHSLHEAQKMQGHGDPRTTMRYAHLGQASLLAAAETAGSFSLSPKPPAAFQSRREFPCERRHSLTVCEMVQGGRCASHKNSRLLTKNARKFLDDFGQPRLRQAFFRHMWMAHRQAQRR